ncbi:MAG: 16S rRNA (uracil(1498)-N(3))-methyltransferase [Verrucomicrobia bacterium]|jgi:16S rRNA (uracil1498-N3)-methyltransferase|nr:16S rRNA (uracil(1498)-N(3))-methyltransferase [Verrucomicrobiota bacterium]
MHRFFVPPSDGQKDELELRAQDARHASNVLRLSVGAEVEVFDGLGNLLLARIVACSKRSVSVRIESKTHYPRSKQALGLALPLLKPKAMDWSLQKATELGASHIWLIDADRSVVRWSSKEHASKLEKLDAVLVESMKQCGAVWKPQLSGPIHLAECLNSFGKEWHWIFGNLHSEIESIPLWKAAESSGQESICWCVGPEGDFTLNEIQLLRSGRAQAVDLGPLVLRSETAVACGLSVLGQWIHFRRKTEA